MRGRGVCLVSWSLKQPFSGRLSDLYHLVKVETATLLQERPSGSFAYLPGIVLRRAFVLNRPLFLLSPQVTKRLVAGLKKAAAETGHPLCTDSISGMFGFFFTEGPVRNFADALKSATKKFAKFHRGMLEHGVYLAPSQVRGAEGARGSC